MRIKIVLENGLKFERSITADELERVEKSKEFKKLTGMSQHAFNRYY